MSQDENELCYCNSCRRINTPEIVLDNFTWVGTCRCKGGDYWCFADYNNWMLTCPDCGCSCSAESAPSIDGTGYGHTVWRCDWLPCGWWWG